MSCRNSLNRSQRLFEQTKSSFILLSLLQFCISYRISKGYQVQDSAFILLLSCYHLTPCPLPSKCYFQACKKVESGLQKGQKVLSKVRILSGSVEILTGFIKIMAGFDKIASGLYLFFCVSCSFIVHTDGEYFSRAVRLLLEGSENSPRILIQICPKTGFFC